ncbi:MAG: hypothetical protein JW892_10135 [Anaerolineae bacterium]|nr:hypothetical protein [Anaerolineae bacterium]
MRIIVNPDQLHQMAQQLHRANSDLRGASGNIGRVISGMSLEIRARTNVDERAVAARRQAEVLAERAESLAHFLEERAEAFRRADEQGIALGALLTARVGSDGSGILGGRLPDWVLGSIVSGALFGVGGVIVHTQWITVTGLLPEAQKLAERQGNWWRGYGWKTNAEVDKMLPDVSGFSKSEVLTSREVVTFLRNEFPPAHTSKRNLEKIEYTDQYKSEKPGYYVAGTCYTKDGKSRIEINRQNKNGATDAGKMKSTISHEVGHNVHNNVMSAEMRDAWKEISQASADDEYVSDYAKTKVQEDFAETYAFYMLDPEALNEISPEKYEFMREHVFDGKEYL